MIILSREARLLMRYAAQTHPDLEVSGLGKTVLRKDGAVEVVDIFVPAQEVASADVDIKPEAVLGFMADLHAQRKEVLKDWRCWWHSHAKMGVSPSATDFDTLLSFATTGGVEWAVGVVTNVRQEYGGFLAIAIPFPLTIKDIDVKVDQEEDERLRKRVADMMKHVTKRAPPPTLVRGGLGGYPTEYFPFQGGVQAGKYREGKRKSRGTAVIEMDGLEFSDEDIEVISEMTGKTFGDVEDELRRGEWPLANVKTP